MTFPNPGTTLAGALVYKTVSLADLLPAQAVTKINQLGYADLDFAYGQASEAGTPVSIGGTVDSPVVEFTGSGGSPQSLAVASVGSQGPNGFQFHDASGALWTVLDQPLRSYAADPVLNQAIAMESGNFLLSLELQNLKSEIDAQSGGNPVVFATNPLDGPPCFARGTRIATIDGDRAVEDLVVGDQVRLADGGEAPVVWIGRRRVRVETHPRPDMVAPVRIEAGALGPLVPRRALRVSPDHALYLDGVLVPAGLLVDGDVIVREAVESVEYFHVELPCHAVLLAEGAPAESYADTGNRSMFANASIVALHAEMAPGIGDGLCAELVTSGQRLEAIRDRLGDEVRLARAS